MAEFSVIDLEALRRAPMWRVPYPYLMGSNVLQQGALEGLRRDFPAIKKPGYLTVKDVLVNGTFKQLVEELESDEVAGIVSAQLGFDLVPYPRLTTVMRWSQRKHGRPHTDGNSKLATMLVYMNDNWDDGGAGRLRVLYGDKGFEPYAAEVPPTMGSAFAFLRGDNSWHGHEPFEGERRVVQMAWLVNADELARKQKRNRFSQWWKAVAG
jgi:hypothetical protein